MTLVETLSPIAPFVGAAALEVFYWFQLRRKLLPKKLQAVLRSPFYWIVTVLAVGFGGICAILLFPDANAGQLLLAGAALPTLLKKLVSGFSKDHGPTLGPADAPASTVVPDYLSVA